jgi:hypothetical protein
MKVQASFHQNWPKNLLKPDIKTVALGTTLVSVISSIAIMVLSKGFEPANSLELKSYTVAIIWMTFSLQSPPLIRMSVNTFNYFFKSLFKCEFS